MFTNTPIWLFCGPLDAMWLRLNFLSLLTKLISSWPSSCHFILGPPLLGHRSDQTMLFIYIIIKMGPGFVDLTVNLGSQLKKKKTEHKCKIRLEPWSILGNWRCLWSLSFICFTANWRQFIIGIFYSFWVWISAWPLPCSTTWAQYLTTLRSNWLLGIMIIPIRLSCYKSK